MKKFITVVPLQKRGQLNPYIYRSAGNELLDSARPTRFPILAAVRGYVRPGETFRVIAVLQDSDDCRYNLTLLNQELSAFCAESGAVCSGAESVTVPLDDQVATHVATFQTLIDLTEDDDELFSCMTYGTKPLSLAVQTAVQYAYRIRKNVSLSCVVYGQVDRHSSSEPRDWIASIFDMTALVQLDEIIRALADRRVANPRELLGHILSL